MAKPELSIIIISYNTKAITQNCLDSVIKSLNDAKLEYEIIVVDNASTDGSKEMLKRVQDDKNSKTTVLSNKENVGFGRANNQAVKQAQGRYILLLNSDTVVLDEAIEKLLAYYKTNEQTVHFLGAKLLNEDKSPQPSCGPFYTLPVVFGALFLRGDYWGLTRYSPSHIKKVDWISGACILTKKEYYGALGGFDPEIFMYFEEIDLLYRAHQKGYNTYFYPEARFVHLGSASSGGKKTYPVLKVYEGFIFFYKKHYSHGALNLLRFLLQLKAVVALGLGKLTGNSYLTQTYEKALNVARTS